MILESGPWKDQLAKDAGMIDRWAAKTAHTERRWFLIEHKVFLAAYAMRKLIEGKKLSSSFEGSNVKCEVYSLMAGQSPPSWNSGDIDEAYDFSDPVRRSAGAPELLDTIIHSLLFALSVRQDETIDGFYVTSDHRSDKLWLISLPVFTKMMRQVAADYPSSVRMVRDPDTGKWIAWQGHGDPPPDVAQKFDRATARRRR